MQLPECTASDRGSRRRLNRLQVEQPLVLSKGADLISDGLDLDRPLSITALGDADEGDGVTFYQDRMLRILLSEGPLVLRLIGRAGLSHRGPIDQALRRTESGVSDVLVDLTELEFIEVGCVRQLIDHAGVLTIDGRSVRIAVARRDVLRTLHVCLWPTPPPNLRVEDASGLREAKTG
jgi:hypothetical protein